MAGTRAAHRYAKALLSLASEKDEQEKINADMRLISTTIEESKDLRFLLKSPIVNNKLKGSSLRAIFKEAHQDIYHLFDLLIDNKRLYLLPKVAQAFIAYINELNQVTTAQVTTTVPMTAQMESKILAKIKEITGKDAALHQLIDENLLGGFLLRINDLQYDASISGKLNRLQHKFKQSTDL